MLFSVSVMQAQNRTVKGTVTDVQGEPIIGANVVIVGGTKGVITDLDGKYSIQVPENGAVLKFSYIGFKTKSYNVAKGKSVLDVTLEEDAVMLEQTVVTAMDLRRDEKSLSTAFQKMDVTSMTENRDAGFVNMLQGKVAGLNISKPNAGDPNGEYKFQLRGTSSLTGNTSPLIVIDGIPQGDLSAIPQDDIESIDVLKDASATAIYGARGANGVVVITTKSGAKGEGKATLTFDSYVGVRTLAKRLDVLSVEEFVLADYERTLGDATDPEESMRSWQNRYGGFVDLHENYGNRKGIDWLDRTMGRTTVTQNYRVGVNGGNDKLNYNMSYGYFKDEGAMVYSGSDKHNIALSVKSEVNKRLSVTGRINFDYLKVYGAGVAGNGTNEGGSNVDAKFNKMVQILQYRPTIGIRGSDSDLLAGEDPVLSDADGNVMQNPLIAAAEEKDNKETRTLQANGGLTFKIIKGLTFRNNTGMRYQLYRRELFYGDQSIMGRRNGIYGSIRNTETGSFQTSNVLTYDKRFQKNIK